MAFCLDTDFLVDYLADRPGPGEFLSERQGSVLLSSVSVYELLFGAMDESRRKKIEELVHDYACAPVDYGVAALAAEIQRDLATGGTVIPELDALIAATAILAGAVLVSNDEHHRRVPERFGLKVQGYG